MYNMQSGIKRKSYDVGVCPSEAATRLQNGVKKRERVITGIATDSLNRVVIATTFDGTLNVSIKLYCFLLQLTSQNIQLKLSSLISKQQNWNILLYYHLR